MKKLFFLLVLGIMVLPASSQRHRQVQNSSELVLRTWNNHPFTVIFDRQVYSAPVNVFRLDHIRPGTHRLVVKQRRFTRYGEVSDILYKGDIHIRRRTKMVVRITRNGLLRVVRELPISGSSAYGNSPPGYGGGYDHGYYRKPPLDFEDLKISILNADFENDRQMIAEQAVERHSVLAEDIYRIMTLFSFESTKLEFAKFAYPHCEDKNNYYRLNDAFSFSSSIRKLNDYTRAYGRRGGQYKYYDYQGRN